MKNKSSTMADNSKFCQLCNSPLREQLQLLAHIKKRLYIKYLSEAHQKSGNSKKTTNGHFQINRRMLEIIMGSTLTESSVKCSHEKYFNLFKKKLRCSNSVLADLCEDMIMKMGNRNYQLDVLTQQINSFPKTICSMIKEVNLPKSRQIQQQIKLEEFQEEEPDKNLQKTPQKQRNETAGGNQAQIFPNNNNNVSMFPNPNGFVFFHYLYGFNRKQ